MKNQAYWQQRFAELEYANNQTAQKVFKAEMVRAFDKAMAELDKEIAAWLMRFALNNGVLSITEARKLLNAAELKELKWDVEEYIAKGRENAFTAAWVKELENASAKFHISRLEALKLHIRQYLETAFGTEHKVLTETMNGIYENTYYHTCFEVQHGFNIGWNIGQVDERRLDKVVNSPWAPDGRDFSDRIWTAKEKMVNELQQQITQDLLLGRAPDEAINAMTQFLKDKTHNAKVNAGRLVMTEEAFVASAAQRDAFKDLGVEEYEIVATLDSHTSAICQEMDGKHFPMKDYQPGTTAPPFHVYCRSVTVPYFDDEWAMDGQRAARDSDDGKTYYIPEDMTYPEWNEKFAVKADADNLADIEKPDGSDTMELQRKSDNSRRDFRPLSDKEFDNLTISARKKGAVILRGGAEVEKHLDTIGAAASNVGDILLFRQDACLSKVLEEVHHFEQNLAKLNDNKAEPLRSILNEIDAKQYLMDVSEKYKIPRNEIELTKKQLEYYKKELENYQHGEV